MSASKSERLLNLLIMLLSARGWVTRDRIRTVNEGYRDLDDSNFERTFERDKAELRLIGVPVETGSYDPDAQELGYRIDRAAFELPAISFTPDERAALGAAAHVWQASVTAATTRDALATLRAAGAQPDTERLLTLQPQLSGADGLQTWWEALHHRQEVSFGYRGEPRRIQAWRMLHRRGQWYVIGFDVDRQAPRHFKLSRLTAPPVLVGQPGAFTPPQDVPIDFAADRQALATVAIRRGRGRDVARTGKRVESASGAPEGFDTYQLALSPVLVGEVCALGSDAVALAPQEFVDEVVASLRAVAERWTK